MTQTRALCLNVQFLLKCAVYMRLPARFANTRLLKLFPDGGWIFRTNSFDDFCRSIARNLRNAEQQKYHYSNQDKIIYQYLLFVCLYNAIQSIYDCFKTIRHLIYRRVLYSRCQEIYFVNSYLSFVNNFAPSKLYFLEFVPVESP